MTMMMRATHQTKHISRYFLNSQQRRWQSSASLSKYGLGGHLWKKFDPSGYQQLIRQALSKQVTYMEVAGQEGGDIAMVGAIQSALEQTPEFMDASLTITTRIGYRTLVEPPLPLQNEGQTEAPSPNSLFLPGDVQVTEEGASPQASSVVHNLSSDYILKALETSPLLELAEEMKHLKLVFLLQNPEVQVLELLKANREADEKERQAYIQQKWQPALETLQEYAANASSPTSFGVVSNGLGLPSKNNHPMFFDADLVIDAAKTYNRLSTVQLPVNLLERHGWDMARKIHSAVNHVDVIAMRPLTCYPDLGTGTGYPFRLVDYSLPSLELGDSLDSSEGSTIDVSNVVASDEKKKIYTNDMTGIPAIYQIALQTAMSHFDAEEILEIKQERDLTMEERETLDGCKLVQSMIHDLDSELENVRSFSAHEDELFGRIIPLLYDTFEAMDDRTSDVLQAYFAAYGVAVRYAIAKKTRLVLKEGEDGGSGLTYPDIPQSMTLQEYALRHMLADSSLSRIVIGAATLQDFVHSTALMEHISSEDGSPLDAITKAQGLKEEKKVQEDTDSDKP